MVVVIIFVMMSRQVEQVHVMVVVRLVTLLMHATLLCELFHLFNVRICLCFISFNAIFIEFRIF